MEYNEFLKNKEFNSPEEVWEWIKNAKIAIKELISKAESEEARAEKAEMERDAAVADLRLVSDCRTCGNVSPWCIENPDKCKGWEWRGRKEE